VAAYDTSPVEGRARKDMMRFVTTWDYRDVPEQLRLLEAFLDEVEGKKVIALKDQDTNFNVFELTEEENGGNVIAVLAELDAPRRAPFLKAQELGLDIGKLAEAAGYRFEMGPQYGPYRTV
jgi:DNA-directed RNA polymerase specialized sigma24 family protein